MFLVGWVAGFLRLHWHLMMATTRTGLRLVADAIPGSTVHLACIVELHQIALHSHTLHSVYRPVVDVSK